MQELTFKRITSSNDSHHRQAQELYHSSFPDCERREELLHTETLKDTNLVADTIYIGDQFAGILYYWRWAEFSFIEHFATLPSLRGQGIGGLALEKWKVEQKGRTMILEIEPPTNEITLRRQSFYVKHGFLSNPYHHIHPSYGPTTQAHQLIVMSTPSVLSEFQFDQFQHYSFSHIIRW